MEYLTKSKKTVRISETIDRSIDWWWRWKRLNFICVEKRKIFSWKIISVWTLLICNSHFDEFHDLSTQRLIEKREVENVPKISHDNLFFSWELNSFIASHMCIKNELYFHHSRVLCDYKVVDRLRVATQTCFDVPCAKHVAKRRQKKRGKNIKRTCWSPEFQPSLFLFIFSTFLIFLCVCKTFFSWAL